MIFQCTSQQIQRSKLKPMKHSQFRIRHGLNNNKKSRVNQAQKTDSVVDETHEFAPSSSSVTYQDVNNYSSNDAFINLFRNIMGSLQQLTKSPLIKRNDLQVRDRAYFLQIPNGKSFLKSKQMLKKWTEKMISDIVSISFNYFSNDQFTYQQVKIYCSENILSNIAALVKKYKLTSSQLREIDEFIRDDVLELLSKKYPMTQSIVVNRALEAIAKAPDLSQKLENDFFSINKIELEQKTSQLYSQEIKLIINTIINQVNEPNPLVAQSSNFEIFQKLMTKIFQMVEDSDWMTSKETERNDLFLTYLYRMQLKDSTSLSMKSKESVLSIQNDNLKRQYKEKVKQYTSYLIGRKVSENIPPFSIEQMKASHVQIKSTAILRILTKWCEQLWQKFIPKNYYVNKNQDFRLLNGEVKSVSLQMRSNLDKLMQAQKAEIKVFMAKVTNDNYQAQINLLNQLLQNSEDEFWEKNLEKISQKFSVLIGKSLEKWVVKYLNRLMEGLTNVSNQFYRRYFSNEWSAPPNLITFKIGDLMRCKCSSGQRQIRYIFQLIKWLSDNHPQILSITRIKNRLNLGTNDILMNIKFCGSIICEIQLAVNIKKSKFIKSSNGMSHYLYQIQRSLFGPINELGSIWRNLDLRATYFDKNAGAGKNLGSHRCQSLKKAFQFDVFDAPFICSLCNNTYSKNKKIIKHIKCSECSYWKCSHCQIKQIPLEKLIQLFIFDVDLKKICEKNVIIDEQNKQLPQFGISVHLDSEKKSQVFVFKKIEVRGVNYLFARQNGKLKLLLKITQEGMEAQYLKQHLVFEINQENGTNFIDLSIEQVTQQYFLPLHISECYKNHKNAITLQNQPINSTNASSIFEGKQENQMAITTLSLTNTKLASISPLEEIFPNLEQLILQQNNDLLQFETLPLFLNLKELTLRNSTSLYQIPESIFKLSLLTKLDLKNCIFVNLPESIGQLKKLKYLDCSHSEQAVWKRFIRKIPKELYELSQLQELNLSFQCIFQLDEDIGKLKKLKYLNIRKNGLCQLPQAITDLSELQFLDFRENPLKKLPKKFGNLRRLKQFRLQNVGEDCLRIFNQKIYRSYYEELPEDLQQIENLKIIEIHSQKLKQLPSLEKCQNLEQINLFRCCIIKFPKLKNCQSLKRVSLKQQMSSEQSEMLTSIPYQFFKETPNLIYFCASYNNLRSIPESIGFLTKLVELDLSRNQIEGLCEQIGQCKSLVRLNLWLNKIKKIPNSIKRLQKLQFLSLSQNQLTEINQSLCECIGLHELIINSNKLSLLPESMGNLVNLQALDLQENLIEYIPKSLGNLKKLKPDMLRIYKNPIYLVECPDLVQRSGDNLSQHLSRNLTSGSYYVSYTQASLTKLSKFIKKATHLTDITINSQSLDHLPIQFEALNKLSNAQFKENKFTIFPSPLANCINLKRVSFQSNQIQAIPAEIGKLVNLQILLLSFNQIKTIDIGINNCTKLTEVDLTENKLVSFDKEIFSKLSNLVSISIIGNLLINFPEGLFKCCKLKKINLAFNQLKNINGNFKELIQLKVLNLQKNEFVEFPQQAIECKSLQQLNLSKNKITNISENLYKLTNLSQFSMNQNCLTSLPRSFGKVTSLKYVNFANNQITVVIKELEQLINVGNYYFNLYNNPLKKVECRDWIMEKGTEETRNAVSQIRS